jgi:23S rRNA (adenine2503-C2)-methyltransferase
LSISTGLGERVSHVVLMGIGEPFDNYDKVMRFLRRLNHTIRGDQFQAHDRIHLRAGAEIIRFSQEELPINLSISLHAPNDAIRTEIHAHCERFPLGQKYCLHVIFILRRPAEGLP